MRREAIDLHERFIDFQYVCDRWTIWKAGLLIDLPFLLSASSLASIHGVFEFADALTAEFVSV